MNAYGRDLRPQPRRFAELLETVGRIPGIRRVRYTSPHPQDIKQDVVDAHARLETICDHIHLPLQSGSSRILKAMRRTYNRERFLDRVAMIRAGVPDVSLSTDIIVGFPGETDADFEETLEVCRAVQFDSAFTFIFSPRRGTEAATFTDGLVPPEVKSERMQRLVEVVQESAYARAQRFVGRSLEVLIEGPSRTDPTRMRGRTSHNKAVNFEGAGEPGTFTQVTITGATSHSLSGEQSLVQLAGH